MRDVNGERRHHARITRVAMACALLATSCGQTPRYEYVRLSDSVLVRGGVQSGEVAQCRVNRLDGLMYCVVVAPAR